VPELDAATTTALIEALTAVAVRAALIIRQTIGTNDIHRKGDGSPVTAADLASEAAIRDGLSRAVPGLPIVSEEQAQGAEGEFAATRYFLVDPLDGTREFIDGRDEYTVNIALIADGTPVLGVIAAPALGLIWRGLVGKGAEHLAFAAEGQVLPASPVHARRLPPCESVVLVSRSHLDPRTQAYLERVHRPRTIACGSALKFCRIAEGSADLYPRLAPTHDWDVAAGHAIVEAAGGRVRAPDGALVRYGSRGLLIPGFVAGGKA
jgi:3'(2'), 5'-bisphosphate nucleotidase